MDLVCLTKLLGFSALALAIMSMVISLMQTLELRSANLSVP